MNLLKLKNINSGYGKKQILFDLSFEIYENEILLLVGSNGSGKSTLLKTIFGLLKPWNKNSEILFEGNDIKQDKPSQLIRKGIIYIPQQNELFEDLTVRDNLELSAYNIRNKKELGCTIEIILEQFSVLKTLSKRKCTQLSGGERKLLSFAMALINHPKLIMLDEPLAGTSPKNKKMILYHIKKLKNQGISILLVEHRVKDVYDLSDRVIGLKLGNLFKNNLTSLKEIKELML
jgi:branched-chain amino acid transport system ATP-binding protein